MSDKTRFGHPYANDARLGVAGSLGQAHDPRWWEIWRYEQNILGSTKRRVL